LNADLIGRHAKSADVPATPTPGALSNVWSRLPRGLGRLKSGPAASKDMPSIFDVMSISLNIMQVRITRSRLAGEPADILIRPRLANFALMDYHRAEQAIEEG